MKNKHPDSENFPYVFGVWGLGLKVMVTLGAMLGRLGKDRLLTCRGTDIGVGIITNSIPFWSQHKYTTMIPKNLFELVRPLYYTDETAVSPAASRCHPRETACFRVILQWAA